MVVVVVGSLLNWGFTSGIHRRKPKCPGLAVTCLATVCGLGAGLGETGAGVLCLRRPSDGLVVRLQDSGAELARVS